VFSIEPSRYARDGVRLRMSKWLPGIGGELCNRPRNCNSRSRRRMKDWKDFIQACRRLRTTSGFYLPGIGENVHQTVLDANFRGPVQQGPRLIRWKRDIAGEFVDLDLLLSHGVARDVADDRGKFGGRVQYAGTEVKDITLRPRCNRRQGFRGIGDIEQVECEIGASSRCLCARSLDERFE